jgi:rubrerythrin
MSDIVEKVLKESIIGESNAVKMYRIFSEKASSESFPNIGLLFVALANAEEVHIKNHISALGNSVDEIKYEDVQLGSTLENLNVSLEGEVYEYKKMYPSFLKEVKKKKNLTDYEKVALLSMRWSSDVERQHAKLLKMAIGFVARGEDIPYSNFYLCRVCGNLELDIDRDDCKICGHDTTFFVEQ